VLDYLRGAALVQRPFCLIVSLVNPHDVLFYPTTYQTGETGYTERWLSGTIEPPATVNEDLSSKPSVQQAFLTLSNAGLGKLTDVDMQKKYLNFYGNLLKSSDHYLVQVLDALRSLGLMDNTLIIRTADHGEMGLSHGGQRQKNFNFYEESLSVPLIYSNPRLFPEPVRSDALVSHVDFLPTLASLFNAPADARSDWQGIDYSSLIADPMSGPVQDYVVFTSAAAEPRRQHSRKPLQAG
jgi:arylsulfatase A-like enzyme